jgi:hypothetical protein
VGVRARFRDRPTKESLSLLSSKSAAGLETPHEHAEPDSLQIPCFSLFGRLRRSIQSPELPEKSANRSKTDSSKWRNSLKISLFAGMSFRDEFDADCVHRHTFLQVTQNTHKHHKIKQM